jgi:hypothetical protein
MGYESCKGQPIKVQEAANAARGMVSVLPESRTEAWRGLVR